MKTAVNTTAKTARKLVPKTSAARGHANNHAIKRGSKRTEQFIAAMMGIRLK